MKSFDEMVNEVTNWLSNAPINDQEEFKASNEFELYGYHSSLGRTIRNYFKLWNVEWTPEIVNGIDQSPNHPDAISMEIIRTVWRNIQ